MFPEVGRNIPFTIENYAFRDDFGRETVSLIRTFDSTKRRRFDAYIGAWLDEPSPRGLADQWTRGGWEALNYGHYGSPVFDSLFSRASRLGDTAAARAAYSEAMDTLNADAPAVFLYTPTNAAAVSRRIENVRIDPYSWLRGISDWRVRMSR